MSFKDTLQAFSNFFDEHNKDAIAKKINESEARLDIYENNVLAARSEALKVSYPLVAKIVGDKFFDIFARNYASNHDSVSGNLDDYGDKFLSYIYSNIGIHRLPYLYDVALFELNSSEINKEKSDIAGFEFNEFSEEELFALKPRLCKAAKILKSNYAILSLFEYCKDEINGQDDFEIERPENILIYKDEFFVKYMPLTNKEFEFLESFNGERSFLEIFEDYQQKFSAEEFSNNLGKLYRFLTITGKEE